MAKLSSLKLYIQIMEPEEIFKRPRIALNAFDVGNHTSAQLTQIRDFKENSKKYRNDMQQFYSLMISSSGPVPLLKAKVEFIENDGCFTLRKKSPRCRHH